MNGTTDRSASCRGFALACSLLAPGVLLAQVPAERPSPTTLSQADVEEIIVTGTRIARDPGNYVGPMTTVSEEALEQIPSYSLKDVLDQIPSIGSQGTGRNNSNGGRGIEFTEIHQLEPQRTLVLLNGRRMVSTIAVTIATSRMTAAIWNGYT